MHERQLRAREILKILDQPAAAAEPPEGSLDNPPLRNHHEAFGCIRSFDNLQNHLAGPFRGRGCCCATVGAIGKQALQEHEHAPHTLQKRQKAIPVLHVGRCHIQSKHQAQRVDDEVTLLAFDFLGRVIADRIDMPPPFSALLTLWLSTIAAVGLAWRPSSPRTCW